MAIAINVTAIIVFLVSGMIIQLDAGKGQLSGIGTLASKRISKPLGIEVWSKMMPPVQLGPAIVVEPTRYIAAAAANLEIALKDIKDIRNSIFR